MTEQYEVVHYIENGKDIFNEWYSSLRDFRGRAAVDRVINRLELGHLGENHYCRDGVWELIIKYGAGYRIYYAMVGKRIVLLLSAGTKRTQQRDIEKAIKYFENYKEGQSE